MMKSLSRGLGTSTGHTQCCLLGMERERHACPRGSSSIYLFCHLLQLQSRFPELNPKLRQLWREGLASLPHSRMPRSIPSSGGVLPFSLSSLSYFSLRLSSFSVEFYTDCISALYSMFLGITDFTV